VRGAILQLPQYAFIVWFSVNKKHRDKFTFLHFTLIALFKAAGV